MKDNTANNKGCEVVLSTSLVLCAAPNTCWEQTTQAAEEVRYFHKRVMHMALNCERLKTVHSTGKTKRVEEGGGEYTKIALGSTIGG